jgi:predicted nucleotidyltransferase
MAKDEIERDIGEMRACVSNIKLMLQTSHENETNIFARLGSLEQNRATIQQQVVGIDKRIDQICEEREKEKDRELTRMNNKIALWALLITILNIGIAVAGYFVGRV